MAAWEDMISLKSSELLDNRVLGNIASYLNQESGNVQWDRNRFPLDRCVENDNFAIPLIEHREGYYGENHFDYWASGLRDLCSILEYAEEKNIVFKSILDIGCSSGRLIRHLAAQCNLNAIYGCDINRMHVDWCGRYLPQSVTAFQTTSLPYIPLESNSVDLVTAFSVFTHIESFDTSWLMELRRILTPGGIAWLTVHSDRTWREVEEGWPLYEPLIRHHAFPIGDRGDVVPVDRATYRWHDDKSYSSNVFYSEAYLKRIWGKFFDLKGIIPAIPKYQDVVILQKR